MLTLQVQYTLSEYLAVIDAFVPYVLTAREEHTSSWKVRHPTVRTGFATRAFIRVVASAAFVYKVMRVGDCRFTFSESGVVRESKSGTLTTPWPEIARVFRLPTAFLFAKVNGAMPVPYSCMSGRERIALEQLLAQFGHGPDNAA